jgi:hypothetical protein
LKAPATTAGAFFVPGPGEGNRPLRTHEEKSVSSTLKEHPMKAAIIPADLSQPIRFEDVEDSLDQLQKAVGGDVELVGLRALSMNLYLNEEGKYEKLAVNSRATTLCHEYRAIRYDDYIAGDIILVGPFDDEGENTDLTAAQITWLTAADESLSLVKNGK